MTTHLDNMPCDTIRFPKWFWPLVGAVALWAMVMIALACNGCRASVATVPTTQQVIAPAKSAEVHVQNAEKSAEATVPFVAPEGKPHIENTLTEIRAAMPDIKTTIEQTVSANAEMRRMAGELQSEKDARTSDRKALEAKALKAKLDGEERWQKEHDANEWIGWHTKTYLVLTGILVSLGVVAYFGAPFLKLIPVVGGILSALATIFAHFVTAGLSYVFGWLDTWREWSERKVAKPEAK